MKKMPSLESLFSYQPDSVLSRYRKDYPDNRLSAEKAWNEMLKFLWLSQKHTSDKATLPNDASLDFECAMLGIAPDIDDMWHTFLLFTEEYAQFCNHYFGKFLHHRPNTEKIAFSSRQNSFQKYLSYIFDNLGESTLKAWFQLT